MNQPEQIVFRMFS